MVSEKDTLHVAILVILVGVTSAAGTALLARHLFNQRLAQLAQEAQAQAEANQPEVT